MSGKHKQEDPWAGFVDVLSSILMVVVFLIVVLGMAIFALSQQIVQNAVKSEQQAQAKASATIAEAMEQMKSEAVAKQAETSASKTQQKEEAKEGVAGTVQMPNVPRPGTPEQIIGNTALSVPSALTQTSKEVEIAPEEARKPDAHVIVNRAQAFLTLKFGRGVFRIDQAAGGEIKSFLEADQVMTAGNLEIRAFAQSTVGSISEARRIAYYRAMETRAELIKSGVPSNRLSIRIRESSSAEEVDVVRVFLKM